MSGEAAAQSAENAAVCPTCGGPMGDLHRLGLTHPAGPSSLGSDDWEPFACYHGGTRHYYVRKPYGNCPPARVSKKIAEKAREINAEQSIPPGASR